MKVDMKKEPLERTYPQLSHGLEWSHRLAAD